MVRRNPLGAAPSVASVMADPAASSALKTVLRTWGTRDAVDAANDAAVLARVLAAEARLSLGDRT